MCTGVILDNELWKIAHRTVRSSVKSKHGTCWNTTYWALVFGNNAQSIYSRLPLDVLLYFKGSTSVVIRKPQAVMKRTAQLKDEVPSQSTSICPVELFIIINRWKIKKPIHVLSFIPKLLQMVSRIISLALINHGRHLVLWMKYQEAIIRGNYCTYLIYFSNWASSLLNFNC